MTIVECLQNYNHIIRYFFLSFFLVERNQEKKINEMLNGKESKIKMLIIWLYEFHYLNLNVGS